MRGGTIVGLLDQMTHEDDNHELRGVWEVLEEGRLLNELAAQNQEGLFDSTPTLTETPSGTLLFCVYPRYIISPLHTLLYIPPLYILVIYPRYIPSLYTLVIYPRYIPSLYILVIYSHSPIPIPLICYTLYHTIMHPQNTLTLPL